MHPHPSDRSSASIGLVAWLEATRIHLPLKGVECRFHVTGAIVSVELDQIYHQASNRPLDCTYTFPLPADAAVYRCELHVNDRMIRAKVEEQGAAQELNRKFKIAGRRTALVVSERKNLFTLSLGNIQPCDVIVVRFAWFQVLDRVGDGFRLFVPTCPGQRYIPGKPLLRGLSGRGTAGDTDQVPDASRISPPRIDALHPDAAYFSLEGQLDSADVVAGTLTSPSHPVCVREAGGGLAVSLPTQGAIPDRDLVLVWQEPRVNQLVSHAWRQTGADATYALAQLRAPGEVRTSDEFSQDFYFLVDRSGSMDGVKWQRTCTALRSFVGLLGPDDRVAITLFESTFRDYAEKPLPATRVFADPGFQQLEKLGTAGGTELLPATQHVLRQLALHSQGRRTTAVLITDGQVGNESAVIQTFAQAPTLKVHTFGIDTTVNDAFLKKLAEQQLGGCWLQTPDDDIAGTVTTLGERLRRPVLTDLSVWGEWETGRPSLPCLHARETVSVSLRGQAEARLEIRGLLPDGRVHALPLETHATTNEAIRLLWARERIAALLSANRRDEAIALAKIHNLLCEGAAFIAWDEAEQVAIATEELVQPAMESASYGIVGMCQRAEDRYKSYMMSPERRPYDIEAERLAARILPAPYSTSGLNLEQRIMLLRTNMLKAGLPSVRIETLVIWAEAGPIHDRLRSLEQTTTQILGLRLKLDSWLDRTWLNSVIALSMDGPPESAWSRVHTLCSSFSLTLEIREKLIFGGAPAGVIEQVVKWVWHTGRPTPERFVKLRSFTQALVRHPPDRRSKDRVWQALVDTRSDVPTVNPDAAENYIIHDDL